MALDRIYITGLGEYYADLLKIEAFLKGSTQAAEGKSLLCSKLVQREEQRNRILQHLAAKRRITVQELQEQILTDTAEEMTNEEFKELRSKELEG